MVKLFVGNIAEGVTSGELRDHFSNYGNVTECDVLGNYGFVHMSTDVEAEDAIKHMDKYNVGGQQLNVEKSKSSGRGGGGGGGHSNSGGARGRGGGPRSGNGYGSSGGGGGSSANSAHAKSARRSGCTKLHVANLADGLESRDLRNLFERYGSVVECDIVEDRKIAFVHIETTCAEAAIRGLNGRDFRGMPLKVQMSKNQNNSEFSGDSYGFRGGGMGRGGFEGRRGGRGRYPNMPGGFRNMGRGGGYGMDYDDLDFDDLLDNDFNLPQPAKDRFELLELLDQRRRLEALDPYERRLIACPDPFNLPPPPPEYLRLLRERAMVKARLPLPPATGPSSLGGRGMQGQQSSGSPNPSLARALIARRAAAVAANAREKLRSAVGLDGDRGRSGGAGYMYAGMANDY